MRAGSTSPSTSPRARGGPATLRRRADRPDSHREGWHPRRSVPGSQPPRFAAAASRASRSPSIPRMRRRAASTSTTPTRTATPASRASGPRTESPTHLPRASFVDQPFANHNGGQLLFGPDGYSTSAWATAAPAATRGGRAEPADPARQAAAHQPVCGRRPGRGEVFSIGLRNPWRFSFDRQGGDLYVADVGQNEREEVDVSTAASGGRTRAL